MTNTTPTPTIAQADRDAAANYYYSSGGSPTIARRIREGEKDTWFRVQAFTAHRESAEARGHELGYAHAVDDAVNGRLPKHRFWGGGEPDCPKNIKAGNGELHTLLCKNCGQENPCGNICPKGGGL